MSKGDRIRALHRLRYLLDDLEIAIENLPLPEIEIRSAMSVVRELIQEAEKALP